MEMPELNSPLFSTLFWFWEPAHLKLESAFESCSKKAFVPPMDPHASKEARPWRPGFFARK
jgi:hypothetical protein